jgi:hypothetical protein
MKLGTKYKVNGTLPECPKCGKPVEYRKRFLAGSDTWYHKLCTDQGIRANLFAIPHELGFYDRESRNHCLAILAVMNKDGDIEEAAKISGLKPKFISKVLSPLIEQGILEDGIWNVDSDIDINDPQHCAILVTMWVLCSQGLVKRGTKDDISLEICTSSSEIIGLHT